MTRDDHAITDADLQHMMCFTRSVFDQLSGSRLFLTGGSGFVGTWMLEALAHANRNGAGIDAVVLIRDPDALGHRAPRVVRDPRIRFRRGDMTDFAFPEGRFDYVIHLATPLLKADTAHPDGLFSEDVAGMQRVLAFVEQARVRRLLYASSGAVYGAQPKGMARLPETFLGGPDVTDPKTDCGQAKRACEYLCHAHAAFRDFEAVTARLFTFVGAFLRLHLGFAVGNFIRDALQGGPIVIEGDGSPLRTYLYAADMTIWLWTILARGEVNRIYNVGAARPLSIAAVAELVGRVCGVSQIVAMKERVPGAPRRRYVPDVTRAEVELDLHPRISLREGIKRMYAWARRSHGR